jgi:hypothetical protein
MGKGKFLLPGSFAVISLIFVALWALADVISLSTSTEILGIWATNNNSTAIVASHSWDVTCNNTVLVAYSYCHTVLGVDAKGSGTKYQSVDPPGDVHTETWITYWDLPAGNYTAWCATFAEADGETDSSSDTAYFTVP